MVAKNPLISFDIHLKSYKRWIGTYNRWWGWNNWEKEEEEVDVKPWNRWKGAKEVGLIDEKKKLIIILITKYKLFFKMEDLNYKSKVN